MDYFSIFMISFTIALTGALSPGPLLTACIAESTRQGFKSGPLLILGHAILEIIMVGVLVLGFARFIKSPALLKAIGVAGALILTAFGAAMIASLPKLDLNFDDKNQRSSNLVLMGITMSLANPYWTIWWMSIGLGLVLSAQKAGFTAIGIFFAGHILADLGWYSLVSFTVSKGKRFISLKIYKIIIFVCACTLIGFGIYFGKSSLQFNKENFSDTKELAK